MFLTMIATFVDPRSWTNRGTTPVSIITDIFSLGPSVKYESAQHASATISSSWWLMRKARAGRADFIDSKFGAGFLFRHKLDSVQVTLRRNWHYKTKDKLIIFILTKVLSHEYVLNLLAKWYIKTVTKVQTYNFSNFFYSVV